MMISGLTEFLIIGSIIYALITLPSNHNHISTLYRVSLLITLVAAGLGAIMFLTTVNVNTYHQYFAFISKHTALTTFIIAAAWGALHSKLSKLISAGLILAAFASLFINIFTELSFLSMIILLMALAFIGFCIKSDKTSLSLLVLAVVALLSTLVWGAVIKDQDLMIGSYHVSVAVFYFLITLSFKRI
jgi:hypothetical protein